MQKNYRVFIIGLALLIMAFVVARFTRLHSTPNSNYYAPMASEAMESIKKHGLNENFFILIDLGLHSGRYRFFIWDNHTQSITHKYLVSHGACGYPWGFTFSRNNPEFSNQPGSKCSSIGKYIIGARGSSTWGVGTKYLLNGLEDTNSNAVQRNIVFHSWSWVANCEIFPLGTVEGSGCPAVSNKAFNQIDSLLQSNDRPTLMWIIDSSNDDFLSPATTTSPGPIV